ncbi:hypothetical protein ACTL6U_05370 [Rhodovibrionaceae bacterium A322]
MKNIFSRGSALKSLLATAVMGLALAGCSYDGSGIEKPFTQKVAWFSFLNGDDIRKSCNAGSVSRYRLVYNGRYDEQVRTYEIAGDALNGGQIVSKVRGNQSLTQISSDNPLGPWSWQESRVDLSPEQMRGFEKALVDDGFFAGAPEGLRLNSRGFYWLAVGCRDAKVYFHAWSYPSASYSSLTFPSVLANYDQTGLAFNAARDLPVEVLQQKQDRRGKTFKDDNNNFDMTVGENGLRGVFTLF